jgi:hypothetical protein
MKRTFIIWIISFGLVLNASYIAYSNIKAVNIVVSPFVLVAFSLIAAYGIFI